MTIERHADAYIINDLSEAAANNNREAMHWLCQATSPYTDKDRIPGLENKAIITQHLAARYAKLALEARLAFLKL